MCFLTGSNVSVVLVFSITQYSDYFQLLSEKQLLKMGGVTLFPPGFFFSWFEPSKTFFQVTCERLYVQHVSAF